MNTKESLATGKETQFTKQTNAEEESRSNTKSMLLEDDIDAGAISKVVSPHQDVVRHKSAAIRKPMASIKKKAPL